MLDTDQLRSFLAIVDTGSFTRAAERVHKTQSAVSMHMRRLEEQLGCELFLKEGRGVRLSGEGEKLIDYARRMLQIEAAALATIAQKGLAGRVRLGMPDDYAEPFLAEILSGFSHRHPLVEVMVVCEASRALARRIEVNDLDLAVVTDCDAFTGVEVVREEPMVWIASSRMALNLTQPLPLALGNSTCDWRAMALAALQREGLLGRVIVSSNNYAALSPVVKAGLALSVLPLGAVQPGLRILGRADGLPELAPSRMGILTSSTRASREAMALADNIRTALALPKPGEARGGGKGVRVAA